MQNLLVTLSDKRVCVAAAVAALSAFGFAASASAQIHILSSLGGTITTDASGRTWNDLTFGAQTKALVDQTGTTTGVSLTIGNPTGQTFQGGFNNTNFGGGIQPATGTAAALGYLVPTGSTQVVTSNSDFGNSGTFNNLVDPVTQLTLTGLSLTNTYSFTFFASRTASDNRDTTYTTTSGLLGTTVNAETLAVANNSANVVSTPTGLTATPSTSAPGTGTVTITVQGGPNNSNNSGANLYYLSILDITETPITAPVPEPTALSLIGVAAVGLIAFARRRLSV